MQTRQRILALTVVASAAATIGAVGSAQQAVDSSTAFVKRPKIHVADSSSTKPVTGRDFGAPLADLNPVELAVFGEGLEEFQSIETPEGGLGPIFNGASCAECHKGGAVGGASDILETRFGRRTSTGFDPLTSRGGSLLQSRAIVPEALERVPREANVVAQRVTTPLFGAGLIEAIADETIELGARRRQSDGVSGKVAHVTDVVSGAVRVGRFGWKAQHATVLAFAADAYLNEMGITNRFFPTENAPNGRADLLALYDHVPDIEDAPDPATGRSDIDASSDFIRFLAPPPVLPQTAATLGGARRFDAAGCTACHTPVMFTAPNPVAALSNKPVPLYSDLLLHDMGRLGDGIEQAAAGAREMRTAPLWGLRARPLLLHDGRAKTAAEAIGWHDGEAAAARRRFEAMPASQQRELLQFLATI